jgi:hypothetical protein
MRNSADDASARNKANLPCRADGVHSTPYKRLRAGRAKQSQFAGYGEERLPASLQAGPAVRNKANPQADGGQDPAYGVAEGLSCETKPIRRRMAGRTRPTG